MGKGGRRTSGSLRVGDGEVATIHEFYMAMGLCGSADDIRRLLQKYSFEQVCAGECAWTTSTVSDSAVSRLRADGTRFINRSEFRPGVRGGGHQVRKGPPPLRRSGSRRAAYRPSGTVGSAPRVYWGGLAGRPAAPAVRTRAGSTRAADAGR